MRKGITWISELTKEDEDGKLKFLSIEELTEKLGFQPITFNYQSLFQAIPRSWRRHITENVQEDEGKEGDYKLIDR